MGDKGSLSADFLDDLLELPWITDWIRLAGACPFEKNRWIGTVILGADGPAEIHRTKPYEIWVCLNILYPLIACKNSLPLDLSPFSVLELFFAFHRFGSVPNFSDIPTPLLVIHYVLLYLYHNSIQWDITITWISECKWGVLHDKLHLSRSSRNMLQDDDRSDQILCTRQMLTLRCHSNV